MIDLKNFKVNMTTEEFDEFDELFSIEDYWSASESDIIKSTQYEELKKCIFTGTVSERVEHTNQLAVLWAVYDPENPYDLIEITPSKIKKWFVVSKHTDEDGDYVFVSNINRINDFVYSSSLEYINSPKCLAHAFNTEEEANQWKTPQMRVVNSEEVYEN